MCSKNIFTEKAYAFTLLPNGNKKILPIFDTIVVKKTKRKKIQIIVSGKYKNGVCNNEQSELYQIARKFFDAYGFSFGIEIFITKNIPYNSGFGENFSQQAIIIKALNMFSQKKFQNDYPEKISDDIFYFLKYTNNCDIHTKISLIFFPKFRVSKKFLEKSIKYRNISSYEFILESFFDVYKKIKDLQKQKNQQSLKIKDFGLVGESANIWIEYH